MYNSQNTLDADGEFQQSIALSPASTDMSYLPMDVVAGGEVLIVAEWVAVI